MTARGPGGRIAPDGRPPRAKGVGKNARRHDLEAPATPGLHGSDLQQGDVQMMEQGQRVAPRPKKQQASAGPSRRRAVSADPNNPVGQQLQVPDPIQFASQRIGGQGGSGKPQQRPLDIEKWKPLLRRLASNPQMSGPLTTTFVTQLGNMAKIPNTSGVTVIDMATATRAIEESL